jgi:hypothetical protein
MITNNPSCFTRFAVVRPIETVSTSTAAGALSLGVAAHATVLADPAAVASLRRQPLPIRGEVPPASLFKHVDEQTVVGLAAICHAIGQPGLQTVDLGAWAVVAAPRFLGRGALAETVKNFQAEGAWGVSPHVIPHRSLHSLSGMVSQVLQIHGPNFGVGGGPEAASEAIYVAATLLAAGQLPGLLLVLTGYSPEPIPPGSGDSTAQPTSVIPICQAAALALVPAGADWQGAQLRLQIADCRSQMESNLPSDVNTPPFTLERFVQALGENGVRPSRWQLSEGDWVEFCPAGSPAESSL